MTHREIGIYIRLLCYQWNTGYIPADELALWRIVRCEVPTIVLEKFPVTEAGKRVNQRLAKVRQSRNAFSDAQRARGQKGASAKWQEIQSRFPQVTPKPTSPDGERHVAQAPKSNIQSRFPQTPGAAGSDDGERYFGAAGKSTAADTNFPTPQNVGGEQPVGATHSEDGERHQVGWPNHIITDQPKCECNPLPLTPTETTTPPATTSNDSRSPGFAHIPDWDEFWAFCQMNGGCAEFFARDKFLAAEAKNWDGIRNWTAFARRVMAWWNGAGRPMAPTGNQNSPGNARVTARAGLAPGHTRASEAGLTQADELRIGSKINLKKP